ncbi:hypothetical protein D1114_21025 [Cereibacter sphaeroides]|uniref:Uncharacterized protein n=1 Tax=Cereibacter sphaeroides TaxID=1063 RepID=A0AAX1UFG5_CERSP|nr:hypothetical protein [Cereibacter sphaeroides]RHZ91156.1 hypothetical protein D1114_21025 [Cereibacter sphaeroides]
MPLTLPAAPTPPTLTNPATFEADCSAFLAWMAAIAAAMTGKALLTADIVGTVSQSGGVPTGAIMERGSNANGRYVRFTDGTQICTATVSVENITTAAGNIFTNASDVTWTYPAAFSSVTDLSTFSSVRVNGPQWSRSRATGVSTAGIRMFSPTSAGGSFFVEVAAIGRWF